MKIKKLFFIPLCLALLAPAAVPAAAAEPADKHRTELISETSSPLTDAEARAFFGVPDYDQRVLVVPAALIIMAGAKVWSVIMDNRPTANLASAYASAIPGFDFNWDDLRDWRKVTKKYRFSKDTFLQGRAADIVYEVSFFHGAVRTPGNAGGKGHYIANFTVKPLDIRLKWGWKISLETSISDPMNTGTPREPVAWLNADLKWKCAKPLSTDPEISINSLSVDGLGNLSESAYGEMNISPVRAEENVEPAPSINWN
ncbi:MAG: hypothetical protein Q7R35_06800 [Elusimicrobiota bacterium]|nr:hypothetical protein [Elusimicrobiota bacterium]